MQVQAGSEEGGGVLKGATEGVQESVGVTGECGVDAGGVGRCDEGGKASKGVKDSLWVRGGDRRGWGNGKRVGGAGERVVEAARGWWGQQEGCGGDGPSASGVRTPGLFQGRGDVGCPDIASPYVVLVPGGGRMS
ncbi:hypothetical protein K439DRAFT_1614639 [Ramaria rubella]|nr:hypothetical protein K439DRAFT_1614639 [Ramaria rubella]